MHKTVRDLLEAELTDLQLEVGRAFIAHSPNHSLADQGRLIHNLLKLAERRPSVARILAVEVALEAPSETLELPALTVSTPADVALEVIAEQVIEAVEEVFAPAAPKPAKSSRKAKPAPITGRDRRLREMANLSLEPSKPSLAEPVPGETTYQRGLRLGALRVWAAGQGHKLADKGQVPAPVIKAYEAARTERRAHHAAARETDVERNKARNALRTQPAVVGGAPITRSLPGAPVNCTRPDKQRYSTAAAAREALDALREQTEVPVHEGELLAVYLCPGVTGSTRSDRHYHYGHTRTRDDEFRLVTEKDAALLEKPLGTLNWPKSPLSAHETPAPAIYSELVAS